MNAFYTGDTTLESPREITGPESVVRGLAALPGYVARLLVTRNPIASLAVFAADHKRGFGLRRLHRETLLLLSCPSQGPTELEGSVRALFARHALSPIQDYLSSCEGTRHIAYPVPPLLDGATRICRELLIECYAIQPDDSLHFMLNPVS